MAAGEEIVVSQHYDYEIADFASYSDPATWSTMLGKNEVDFLIKIIPKLPVQEFSKLNISKSVQIYSFTSYNQASNRIKTRYITKNVFYSQSRNGELIRREWLRYSEFLDRVYCIPCKLFCKPGCSTLLASDGFKD